MTDRTYYDYCSGENPMVDTAAIKLSLEAHEMTQHQFADEIGVSYHTIRNRLKYGNWTVLEAWKVSQLLGIPLKTFFAFPDKLAS